MKNLFNLLDNNQIQYFQTNEIDFISDFCFDEKGIDPALIFEMKDCYEMRNYFIEKAAVLLIEKDNELRKENYDIFKVEYFNKRILRFHELARSWQSTFDYLMNINVIKQTLCN